ncbi:MAG TPA: prephenate dehydrogenase/arogenate dehydrogenase family protein [Deltaproteobacteria bacterium]|nr:prephenate dehydrogenase/arogenate dehydrogenase family protein [Deltaproteobacteria bacterium]
MTDGKVFFEKVTIIGVGLIGGSMAMAMKQKGMAGSIVGVGRGLENLEKAVELGAVDTFTHNIEDGVRDADLVVVAVPVLKVVPVIKRLAGSLKRGAIVTDVGSVKRAIIDDVEDELPEGTYFVPGHPIAGTEHSGVGAAFPELFKDRKCILTPTERTSQHALGKIQALWTEMGSVVVIMDPVTHDRALAAISHLPHIIAYSLVNTVADVERYEEDILSYSAGGFRDFTRIASSSPEMWSDICAMNRDFILDMLGSFKKRIESMEELIEKGDLKALREDFERAKSIRDSLVRGERPGAV